MREHRDLLRAYEPLVRAGHDAVLATVVRTRGSTYRKPGARMLMTQDAWLAGAISGGCLERDLLRKAWWRTAEAEALVVTYDGRRQDDDGDAPDPDEPVRWGFGLGCDGSLDVLLERLRPDAACHPLALLARCIGERQRAVLSTVVAAPKGAAARVGQRIAWVEGEAPMFTMPASLVEAVVAQARASLSEQGPTASSRHDDRGGAIEVVHELVLPPRPVIVFGGNYDAVPVTELAHRLGWDVTLVERRTSAAQSRFAAVDRRVVGRAPDVVHTLPIDARTAAIVMTHDYDEDRAILGALLESDVGYLGLLGPRRRADRMLGELAAAGARVDEALSRLHAPIGLDLGGRAPDEIALAIVAEVQATLARRAGRSLRETAALHPRNALDEIAVA